MPCCSPSLLGVGPRVRSFLRDYDALQSLALALIYLQVRIPLVCRLRRPDRPGPPAACRSPRDRPTSALVLAAALAVSACDVKPGDGIGFERPLVFPTVVGDILAASVLSVILVVERDGEL
ncbi:hypothetical protein ZEAMMB73_Zm00001d005229 [Zea mays]|uniref:Uncharacterized protein n=1 Tax=Zea mays TaxID=4577 RepID=A0A1D6EL63_MAIZE|nr:hypothetical protein ZEAMMB73_Zm00001d005229 [Zea mays]